MAKLLVNGINLSSIMSSAEEPKGARRDIGDVGEAVDGTTRITRQIRKRDLSFKSVSLSDADAFIWESFLTGEGEAWSFDSSVYGSKGHGPDASSGASIVAGSAKFGASKLRLAATTGSITYVGAAAHSSGRSSSSAPATYMIWRLESAVWHHYVERTDGLKWKDGASYGSTTPFTVLVGSSLAILNSSGATVDYDDLVAFPFLIPSTWPAIFYAATSGYCPPPFLDLSGDLVPELATRRVFGQVSETLFTAAGGTTKHRLDVELKAK